MIFAFEKLEFHPIGVAEGRHKDGFFEVKARPYASFSLRLCGTGEFMVNGTRIFTKKGDILFMPADTPYSVRYRGSEIIVVHLEGCNDREAENITLQNAQKIEERFKRMAVQWNERHSVNKLKSQIYDILDKIAEEKEAVIGDGEFARCIAYIHAHFDEASMNVGTLCTHGFLSASTLQRKFLAHFGISPMHYIQRLRLAKALDLLIADTLSVREAALACGFSDEKYFSRVFKKQYGYPPSKVRDAL